MEKKYLRVGSINRFVAFRASYRPTRTSTVQTRYQMYLFTKFLYTVGSRERCCDYRNFSACLRRCENDGSSISRIGYASSAYDNTDCPVSNKRRFSKTDGSSQMFEHRRYRKVSGPSRSASASLERSSFGTACPRLPRSTVGS